jgi:endonuclease/exonuclease/phosphatase family metal-dependent hydrolase
LAWLCGAGLSLAAVGAALARGAVYLPPPVQDVVVRCAPDVRTARTGESLRVLVWNVQFGGSTRHEFFYDGGEAVAVPESDVRWTLDAIAEVVRELDPDIILWQELDRGSDRTHRIDMVPELLARLPYPCSTTAPYHRVAYVPFPAHEHLGRVDMHLGVFSRVRLGSARRHQLALLDEPAWRAIFNLKRAVLEVEVPVEGGPDLVLLDTHLSAFSHGDGTLHRQVAQLRRLALDARDAGHAVLLAGDLNSLPPGDDPARLPADAQALYSDATNPIQPLYDALRPGLSPQAYAAAPERAHTYVPYGGRPDRTIDHVFSTGPVATGPVTVLQERLDISDHLPMVVQVRPGVAP